MTRAPHFFVQGGSGSAEAAERLVCRDVLEEHQSPEGALVSDDQHYDVIVIGSGAGGGTLAHRLAPTGKRVLLLERGDYLPRERANWDSTEVFVNGKYRAPEFWLDNHGDEFPPEVNYYVGGNT